MTTLIITILAISQIVTFYLIFKRIKPKIIKPDGIVLKPIPKEYNYEEIDPDHNTVYDVLKSIKLEEWKPEIDEEFSIGNSKDYSVKFQSHDSKVRVRSRMCFYNDSDNDMYFSFYINSKDISIKIDEKSIIRDDIILFLWDYIIEYHENKRSVSKTYYDNGIKNITSNLKALNRSKKLNSIL